jgi:hypothetical protein
MKRGRGINSRDDRSSGIEIRMADALAKINPTDPFFSLSKPNGSKRKPEPEPTKVQVPGS